MPRTVYVANVLGDNLIPEPIPVEASAPVRYGEDADDLFVLYGDLEGVTCALVADDLDDAERIIIRTFGDMVDIDDLQESVNQITPLSESFRRDAGFAVKPPDDEGHIYMDARFDVSDLTADQRDQLALEVSAQGDRSDGRPSVEVVEITFTGAPR